MKEIIDILKNAPAVYLATTDSENTPSVRPVALAAEQDGRLYFTTSDETSMFRDLQANPRAAISVMTSDFVWVRISADCRFTDDLDLKAKILNQKEFLKNTFKTPDNPKLKLFFLRRGRASLCDYSGNPPRVYNF